ncbi:MAG: hypothetical protein IJL37_07020 [Bacteroidaceae bacterium]|nr:hypothetical protein [Bacteroidaceae bacterium]
MAIVLLVFSSCSDNDDPAVEPEEEIVIETPLPADAEPGKIYALSHEKLHATCKFQFYFGDNSTEELRDKYSNAAVGLSVLDNKGNEVLYFFLHSPDFDPSFRYTGFLYDTFELSSYWCERIGSFEYHLSYNADEDFTRNNKYGAEIVKQEWRSPHSFFN